ncbi:MAG: transcriptional regulator [Candidatus Neomarinimicrobiota bacterium]|nr:MAG: transcriptional regulator [Candidatus Neomarinimicrobiota bacterium]
MKNKIKYYRFLKDGMTQQELAKQVGVVRQTIIAIEKGTFNPSVKLALKIASVFGTEVEKLFELEEND